MDVRVLQIGIYFDQSQKNMVVARSLKLAILFFVLSKTTYSQLSEKVENPFLYSAYFELGGNAKVVSPLNIDISKQLIKNNFVAIRGGMGILGDKNSDGIGKIYLLSEITGLIGLWSTRHFLELGPGLTFEKIAVGETENNLYTTLRFGYRYQKRNGIILKIGYVRLSGIYSDGTGAINNKSGYLGVGFGRTF